ncbi:MAG: CCE_0567 family metalloprotein [Pseudomonadota bacterium]
MSEEELKALEKKVKRLKRRATEWAAKVHDLVEERIPADYRELPDLAQSTVEACQAWEEANNELKAAKG